MAKPLAKQVGSPVELGGEALTSEALTSSALTSTSASTYTATLALPRTWLLPPAPALPRVTVELRRGLCVGGSLLGCAGGAPPPWLSVFANAASASAADPAESIDDEAIFVTAAGGLVTCFSGGERMGGSARISSAATVICASSEVGALIAVGCSDSSVALLEGTALGDAAQFKSDIRQTLEYRSEGLRTK